MNGPDEYKFPKEALTWAPYFQRRKEEKYHLDPGGANLVQSEVKRHLPLFEFRKGKKHTYITTVYLDTDKLEFFEKARSFYDDSLKVRIKEYCYRETESAPWLTFDNCFPEIKQRVHGLVVKRRFQLRKELLDRLLRGENIWEEMVAFGNGTEFEGILEFYREFRWYVNRFKLCPKAIINYRRTVYQEDEQDLRITFDDDIVVYKPVPGLYRETGTLARSSLGEPARRFSHVTMEIKLKLQ